MPPTVNLTVIPTGGAVRIDLPDYLEQLNGVTDMVLSRAVSGSTGLGAFTMLYSGAVKPIWIDAGDALPEPLDMATSYVWRVADSTGTSQVGPLMPVSSVAPQPDDFTALFIRLMQATVNGLTLPVGWARPQVTTKMPQGGWAAMPFIVVNLDLFQQTDTGIGQGVINPDKNNIWDIWIDAKRVWRVSILCQDAEERDFFRLALVAAFQTILPTVFAPIGMDVRHSIQASSGTDVSEAEGKAPGFYYCDIMMEVDGSFNVAIVTGYGVIPGFAVTATTAPGDVVDHITVPPGA